MWRKIRNFVRDYWLLMRGELRTRRPLSDCTDAEIVAEYHRRQSVKLPKVVTTTTVT